MHDIPLPIPTKEELEYGKALQKTMTLTKEQKEKPVFADHVLDPAPPVAHGGSTDTADVSWNCPTVQMHIGNWVVGTPGIVGNRHLNHVHLTLSAQCYTQAKPLQERLYVSLKTQCL